MTKWFYCLPWYCLLLVMPGITVAYGVLTQLKIYKKRFTRVIIVLFFLTWVLFIAWTTVIHREIGDFGDFQPLFQSYRDALEQPERYRSNFMNVILFFPAGMLLFDVLSWKNSTTKFWVASVVLCLLSVTIECTQFFLSVGTAEMDDIMHNTFGALLGAGAAWFASWVAYTVATKLKNWRHNYDQTK